MANPGPKGIWIPNVVLCSLNLYYFRVPPPTPTPPLSPLVFLRSLTSALDLGLLPVKIVSLSVFLMR